VLIILLVAIVFVATMLPHFARPDAEAERSHALFNLQSLRSQIELYRAQHASPPPTLVHLVGRTNREGRVGTDPADFPYGPYLLRLPENPLNGWASYAVIEQPTPQTVHPEPVGWLYHAATGSVYLNSAKYLRE
jgi:general secretion pathway protein G